MSCQCVECVGDQPDYPSADWEAGYKAGLIYAAELCEIMTLYTGFDCAVKIREEVAANVELTRLTEVQSGLLQENGT